MVRAYVFISTEIGKVKDVISEVRAIVEIVRADAVTGPYDIVAQLECEELSDLTKDIIDNIHSIDGVLETTTSLAVDLE